MSIIMYLTVWNTNISFLLQYSAKDQYLIYFTVWNTNISFLLQCKRPISHLFCSIKYQYLIYFAVLIKYQYLIYFTVRNTNISFILQYEIPISHFSYSVKYQYLNSLIVWNTNCSFILLCKIPISHLSYTVQCEMPIHHFWQCDVRPQSNFFFIYNFFFQVFQSSNLVYKLLYLSSRLTYVMGFKCF